MRLAATIFAIVAAFGFCARSEGVINLMQRADSLAAVGNWTEAENTLVRAIDSNSDSPTNVLLLSNLGMIRHYAGKDSLALETLNRANAIAPRSVTVLLNRARVNTSVGNLADAYNDFGTVAQLDSTLWEPLFYHGIIALRVGDFDTAAADFDRLEEVAPDSVETHIARATFFESIAEPERAIVEYSRLIDKQPEALYYCRRAMLLLEADRLNEASEDIAEGLRLDPMDGELYLARAILNRRRFRPDDAREDVEKAILYGIPPEYIRQFIDDK